MFIGFYNLANSVTLLGLAFAVMSCMAAISGNSEASIITATLLFLGSGLCDMFDGRIARGSGSRTRKEKLFGIQIDTVCDMVSFGVTPVVIAYCAGYDSVFHMVIYIVYAMCGAIRLAYFNTQAVEDTPDLNMKFFTGVPIPFCCLVLPPLMLIMKLCENPMTLWLSVLFAAMYLLMGILFIINVKIKKLNNAQAIVLIIAELACVTTLLLV